MTFQDHVAIGDFSFFKQGAFTANTPTFSSDESISPVVIESPSGSPFLDVRIPLSRINDRWELLAADDAAAAIVLKDSSTINDAYLEISGLRSSVLSCDSVAIDSVAGASLTLDSVELHLDSSGLAFEGTVVFPESLTIEGGEIDDVSKLLIYSTSATPGGVAAGGAGITAAGGGSSGYRFDIAYPISDPSGVSGLGFVFGVLPEDTTMFPLPDDPFFLLTPTRVFFQLPTAAPNWLQLGEIVFDDGLLSPSANSVSTTLKFDFDAAAVSSALEAASFSVETDTNTLLLEDLALSGSGASLVSSSSTFEVENLISVGDFSIGTQSAEVISSGEGTLLVSFEQIQAAQVQQVQALQIGTFLFSGDSISPSNAATAINIDASAITVSGGLAAAVFEVAGAQPGDLQITESSIRLGGLSVDEKYPILLNSAANTVEIGVSMKVSGDSSSLIFGSISFDSSDDITSKDSILLASSQSTVDFLSDSVVLGDLLISESLVSTSGVPIIFSSSSNIQFSTALIVAESASLGSLMFSDNTIFSELTESLTIDASLFEIDGILSSSTSGASLIVDGNLLIDNGLLETMDDTLTLSVEDTFNVVFDADTSLAIGDLTLSQSGLSSVSNLLIEPGNNGCVLLETGTELIVGPYNFTDYTIKKKDGDAPVYLETPQLTFENFLVTASSIETTDASDIVVSSPNDATAQLVFDTASMTISDPSFNELRISDSAGTQTLSITELQLDVGTGITLDGNGEVVFSSTSTAVSGTESLSVSSFELQENTFSSSTTIQLAGLSETQLVPRMTAPSGEGFVLDMAAVTAIDCTVSSSNGLYVSTAASFSGILRSTAFEFEKASSEDALQVSLIGSYSSSSIVLASPSTLSGPGLSFEQTELTVDDNGGVAQPLTISSPASFTTLTVDTADIGVAQMGAITISSNGIASADGASDIILSIDSGNGDSKIHVNAITVISGVLAVEDTQIGGNTIANSNSLEISQSMLESTLSFSTVTTFDTDSVTSENTLTTQSLLSLTTIELNGNLILQDGILEQTTGNFAFEQELVLGRVSLTDLGINHSEGGTLLLGEESTLVSFGDATINFGGMLTFDEIGGIGEIYLHDGEIGGISLLVFNSEAASVEFMNQGNVADRRITIDDEILINGGLQLAPGAVTALAVSPRADSTLEFVSSVSGAAALSGSNPLINIVSPSGTSPLIQMLEENIILPDSGSELTFSPPSGTLSLQSGLVQAGNVLLENPLQSCQSCSPLDIETLEITNADGTMMFDATSTQPRLSTSSTNALTLSSQISSPVTLSPYSGTFTYTTISSTTAALIQLDALTDSLQLSTTRVALSSGILDTESALSIAPGTGSVTIIDTGSSAGTLVIDSTFHLNSDGSFVLDPYSDTITVSSLAALDTAVSEMQVSGTGFFSIYLDTTSGSVMTIGSSLALCTDCVGLQLEPASGAVEMLSDAVLSGFNFSQTSARIKSVSETPVTIPPVAISTFSFQSGTVSASIATDQLLFDTDLEVASSVPTPLSTTSSLSFTALNINGLTCSSSTLSSGNFEASGESAGVIIEGSLGSENGVELTSLILSDSTLVPQTASALLQLTGGALETGATDKVILGTSSFVQQGLFNSPGGLTLSGGFTASTPTDAFQVGASNTLDYSRSFESITGSFAMNSLLFASSEPQLSLGSPYTHLVFPDMIEVTGNFYTGDDLTVTTLTGIDDLGIDQGVVVGAAGIYSSSSDEMYSVESEAFWTQALKSGSNSIIRITNTGTALLGSSPNGDLAIGPSSLGVLAHVSAAENEFYFKAGGTLFESGNIVQADVTDGVFDLSFHESIPSASKWAQFVSGLQTPSMHAAAVSGSGLLSFETDSDIIVPEIFSVNDLSGTLETTLTVTGIGNENDFTLGILDFSGTKLMFSSAVELGNKLILSGSSVSFPSGFAPSTPSLLAVNKLSMLNGDCDLSFWEDGGVFYFGSGALGPCGSFEEVDAANAEQYYIGGAVSTNLLFSVDLDGERHLLPNLGGICLFSCSRFNIRHIGSSSYMALGSFLVEVSPVETTFSTDGGDEYLFDFSNLDVAFDLPTGLLPSGGVVFQSEARVSSTGAALQIDCGDHDLVLGDAANADALKFVTAPNSATFTTDEISSPQTCLGVSGSLFCEASSSEHIFGSYSLPFQLDFSDVATAVPDGSSVTFSGTLTVTSSLDIMSDVFVGDMLISGGDISCSTAQGSCFDVSGISLLGVDTAQAPVFYLQDGSAASAALSYSWDGSEWGLSVGGGFSTIYANAFVSPYPLALDSELKFLPSRVDELTAAFNILSSTTTDSGDALGIFNADGDTAIASIISSDPVYANDLVSALGLEFATLATDIDGAEATIMQISELSEGVFETTLTDALASEFSLVSFGPLLAVPDGDVTVSSLLNIGAFSESDAGAFRVEDNSEGISELSNAGSVYIPAFSCSTLKTYDASFSEPFDGSATPVLIGSAFGDLTISKGVSGSRITFEGSISVGAATAISQSGDEIIFSEPFVSLFPLFDFPSSTLYYDNPTCSDTDVTALLLETLSTSVLEVRGHEVFHVLYPDQSAVSVSDCAGADGCVFYIADATTGNVAEFTNSEFLTGNYLVTVQLFSSGASDLLQQLTFSFNYYKHNSPCSSAVESVVAGAGFTGGATKVYASNCEDSVMVRLDDISAQADEIQIMIIKTLSWS